ncbi:MAG: substrate-binding domain-containing protein [Anaeromyxobacter sp.]
MKRLSTSLALLLLAAPALAGPKIGVSLPTQREERWVRDRQVMEAAAKKAGAELEIAVADNDATKQAAQCDALIAKGVKVLVLAPHDGAAAAAIVDRATRAGVRVISYDRLVTNSPQDYLYLSFDNTRVGELQAEWLVRKAPKGSWVVLSGAPTDSNAMLFALGAMKVLKPLQDRGDVKVVMDQAVKDWQPAEARRLCEQAIAAQKGAIDAVLAPNDGTAGGCIEALKARGLAGKVPVTGQDAEASAAARILAGTQGMTVFKDTRELGRRAVELAVALAEGRPVDTGGKVTSNGRRPVPSVLLAPVAVTRENLEAVLVESGYLKRSALK